MRSPSSAVSEVVGFTRAALEAVHTERSGPAAIRRVQQQRLGTLLACARRTRLYRDRLSHASTTIHDVAPVTKAEMQKDLEGSVVGGHLNRTALTRFVAQRENVGKLFHERYLVAMTSGTTGDVGIYLHDLPSWALTRGLTFSRIFRDNWNVRDALHFLGYRRYRMGFVVASGGHYMTYLLASRLPDLAKIKFDAQVFSVEQPIPDLVARLNAHAPHLLHSYPTVLELLCAEQKSGRLHIEPELITAGSEPLTPSCREAVQSTYPNARLVETYASTECVSLATSCHLGHLHVNEDACILEPVTETAQPVGLDVLGDRLWVTNLLNTAQPILRYELTDRVRLLSAPCACGSPFRVVEVQGRTDDTFYLQDARGQTQSHPPIPLELVFLRISGLVQYQLVHEEQNRLCVRFVAELGVEASQVCDRIQTQLHQYLAEHDLRETVELRFEHVEALARGSESKKVRQIFSMVARPTGSVQPAHSVRSMRNVINRE